MKIKLSGLGIVCVLGLAMSACDTTAAQTSSDDDSTDDALSSSCSAFSARKLPIELSVTPDAGEAPIVDVLNTATSSVRVMVYILDSGDILDKLLEIAPKVSTKVILDRTEQPTNQAAFDKLTAAGAKVQWSDPQFSYMHAKFLVVNAKDAIIATGNFSKKLIDRERNYLAHDTDSTDVKSLVTLFDADWAHKTPSISCTRLLVSPINPKARLLQLIQGAKKRIDVESMQFADPDIRQAIVDQGVDARILLASSAWIAANASAAKFCADNGLEARYQTTPMVHVKSIIIDGVRSYLGSENLSTTSLTKNREVGIILTKQSAALDTMNATFEADWAAATPFDAPAANADDLTDPADDPGAE